MENNLAEKIDIEQYGGQKWFDKIYSEVGEYKKYMPETCKGGTCIYVGSNVGAFPCFFRDRFKRFICYEPFSLNVAAAQENFKKHKVENVIIHQLAVGADDDKTVKLMGYRSGQKEFDYLGILGNLGTQSIIFDNGDGWDNRGPSERVLTISLESILDSNNLEEVELLKVDCEGAEYDFLLHEDLFKIKNIIIEVHNFLGANKQSELFSKLSKTHKLFKRTGNGVHSHFTVGYVRRSNK